MAGNKSKVEFSELAPQKEWTLQEYIAAVYGYPQCPGWVRVLRDVTKVTPARVSYAVAMRAIEKSTIKTIETCHPRDIVDEYLKIAPVVVSTGGIQVVTKEPVSLKLVAGFYLPTKREAHALPAWISEAAAYQCTPDVRAAPGSVGMTITPEDCDKLKLAEQSFTCDVPSNWTSDVKVNAQALYEMYVRVPTKGHPNDTCALTHSQMAYDWEDQGARPVSRPPKSLMPYVTEHEDGTMTIPMPTFAFQSNQVVTSELFYKVLQYHRTKRGADNKAGSSLTAGYYLGAMTRALDRVLWEAIDILTIAKLTNNTSVLFDEKALNANVAAVLVANDVAVYVSTSGRTHSTLYTAIDLSVTKIPKACLYYSKSYFTHAAPTPSKKGMVGQTEKEFKEYVEAFNGAETIRMTHLYLRDYHAGYLSQIYPSIHCHAGHVIFVNRAMNTKPLNLITHFGRMTLANKYKTAFPVRRVSFVLVDKFAPEILTMGVKIPSSVGMRNETDFVYTDQEIAEVRELSTMDVDPLVFSSKVIQEVEHEVLEADPRYVVDDVDEHASDEQKGNEVVNDPPLNNGDEESEEEFLPDYSAVDM